MLAAAIIVFREVLEAALIVGIVMAATRGMPHRGKWVSLGILGGIAGAGLVAALTNAISSAFEGTGQEIVNAVILFSAVGLIAWHVVWMNSHGRKMAEEMRARAKSVAEGERHMSLLAVVVGLAVMREGSEVVLMLQGMGMAESPLLAWSGAGAGLAAGVLTGGLMYAGLLALSIGRMFALTNGLLILIAAGMAARGAGFLVQADILPALGTDLWDTSFILSENSIAGHIFSILIGYIARPSGIQVLFYALTVGIVLMLMRGAKKNGLAAVALVLFCLALPHEAGAKSVSSPYVTEGEWEIEHEGNATLNDRDPGKRGAKTFEGSIGYSPTDFYKTELEAEWEREGGPGENVRYESFAWKNVFALAEPGEYWIDPALYLKLEFARDDEPNKVIFGVIGATQVGRTLHTVNLFGHKQYGHGAEPIAGFDYRGQSKYMLRQWFEPGFEIYGDTGGKTKFQDQKLAAGPGVFGKIPVSGGQAIKYETVYLFGATRASPSGALRWKLEYEFFF